MELRQWKVCCVTEGRTHYVDLPIGTPPPTHCPVEPGHEVGRISPGPCMAAKLDLSATQPAPGPEQDQSRGWSVGSRLLDLERTLWFCVDATPGAALWKQLTA